ncbi:MAG TPA: UvrD-helicase domain-containing protein [Candidatus Limnocylindria bacterium]|nr:UvrD-helicase domain-containing protein [Candidatus Limnocylindria bacterium]
MPRKPAAAAAEAATSATPPTTEAILAALNPPQREAVEHVDGPLLILAGAGSGKTRVLAHRVAHLVASGVPPYRIVAVTFTNKAAGEMRDRIAGLIGPEATREATIGTFHSICARVLRREGDRIGLTSSFTIYDRADQLAVIKEALRRLDLDDKRFAPSALLAFIGQRKDELADPATAKRQADNFWEETAATVYEAYQRDLAESDAVDFDDLLLRVVFLFEQHPDVLARYQRRWQYVLVDEYQDTNRAQYRLCALLAAVHHNLAVVGDDDQSIYSWRGADLRNILDFERDWPDAKVVKLEQNYRSTQTILDAAHAVVSRVEGRKDKRLWTDRGSGAAVQVFDAYNEYEEAEFVARQVERLASSADRRRGWASLLTSRAEDGPDDGGSGAGAAVGDQAVAGASGPMRFGDIAVAYRVNAQSRVLEEAFMRFGIPYQLVGGVRFYERREVKDALAYARLARNPGDRVALERVINVPARGIGDKTVSELRAWADARGETLWAAVEAAGSNANLATRARTALAGFAELVRGLAAVAATEPASAVLEASLERSGLRAVLDDGTEDGTERWANLVELRNHAAEFDEIAAPEGLARFLEEVALVSDQDTLEERPERVTLITLHAAKGLEFPVVFMVGLEEGLLPYARALDDERELEEERRLTYVGMTRAKDRLYLVHARHRSAWGSGGVEVEPSRFLADLPEDLLEVGAGRRGPTGLGWVRDDAGSGGRRELRGSGATWTGAPSWRGGGLDDESSSTPSYWGRVRPGLEPLRPERLPDLSVPERPALPDVDLGSGTFGHRGNGASDEGSEPPELAWRAGDKVRHRRFGDGIVVSSQWVSGDEEVTVAFAGQGVRRLLGSYAGLERLG